MNMGFTRLALPTSRTPLPTLPEPKTWRVAVWRSLETSPSWKVTDRKRKRPKKTITKVKQLEEKLILPAIGVNRALPGITKVYFHSQVGSWHGKSKRYNQDVYFDVARDDARIIGVCDGHGNYGHSVAEFISQQIPSILYRKVVIKCHESTSSALKSAFKECADLLTFSDIDTSQSGCTCTALLQVDNTVVCASVGDSRAVVGRKTCGIWSVYQLSWDHRTDNYEETTRILENGGEIASPKKSKFGQNRVYLRNESLPGLSLTRSLGDSMVTSIGVTSDPSIEVLTLSCYDKFVLIATRGLWEVMSSIEAVRWVGERYEKEGERVTKGLAEEAQRRWRDRGRLVDDVTVGLAVIERVDK